MTFLHIAVLALVQGLTEFLPVSSSAHLILVPYLTGWPDQGLVIDVAVHVGTLGAVLLYFWRDLGDMVLGLMWLTKGRRDSGARLAGFLVLATLPAVAAGYLLDRYYPSGIRGLEDRICRTGRRHEDDRRVGAGVTHRFGHGVVNGNAIDLGPALARCDSTDDPGSIFDRKTRMQPAHSAEPLNQQLGVAIAENGQC